MEKAGQVRFSGYAMPLASQYNPIGKTEHTAQLSCGNLIVYEERDKHSLSLVFINSAQTIVILPSIVYLETVIPKLRTNL